MSRPAMKTRPMLAYALLATAVAVALVAAPQPAHSQPTNDSGLDGRKFWAVYDVPATRDVKLLANVPYWKAATHSLVCDVYLPPMLAKGEKLPIVVLLNAIGDRTGNSLKDWGIYRTWARLLATRGMIGVSTQGDSADALESMRRLLAFLAAGSV